ncbi:MAG: Fic family protein [Actinobacteria bacterium]|nr:Fic family protein [Actinomycetota bacterium]
MQAFKPVFTSEKFSIFIAEIEEKKRSFVYYNEKLIIPISTSISESPIGYLAARDKVETSYNTVLTEEFIKMVHGLVREKVAACEYNNFGSARVTSSIKKAVVYQSPLADLFVPHYMKELLNWINNDSIDLSIILRAAIFHWQLIKIQPFDDGNGRTAKLLTTFILRKEGYNIQTCHRLENYFFDNRHLYEQALDDGNMFYSATPNLDMWINFFCKALLDVMQVDSHQPVVISQSSDIAIK